MDAIDIESEPERFALYRFTNVEGLRCVAEAETEDAAALALFTLAREGTWEDAFLGLRDRLTNTWLVKPFPRADY